MESIEFSSTSNEKIEYFFSFSFFFFFFFRKILLARNDDIIESIDRCQLLSLSLSLSPLSRFCFFPPPRLFLPFYRPVKSAVGRIGTNRRERSTHPAIFILVFCLGRRRPATAKTVSARSNFWTAPRPHHLFHSGNECTRAIY